MIQSMTGYGKATAELSDKKINIEIKSLNSKAMDLSARIAPLYREKEMEIRNEISKMLERGKVDFSLWIEKKDAEQLATPINQELVEAYYKRIKEISAAAGIPDSLSRTGRLAPTITSHAGRDDENGNSGTDGRGMEHGACYHT